MIREEVLLALLAVIAAAIPARAQEYTPAPSEPPSPPPTYYSGLHQPDELNPAILAVNRSFSLSYQQLYLYYIEPSGVDAFNVGTNYDDYESGWIGGPGLAASYMSDTGWYAHAEWSYVSGNVTYTGYYQNGTPAGGDSHAIIQNYEFKLGHGFPIRYEWLITPYLGIGGRHWVREIGPGTTGDYVESYDHKFLSLGAMAQYSPTDRWVITGDAQIGRTIAPTINTNDGTLSDAALGVAPVLKLGLEGDARLIGPVHGFTGFNFTYFSYGQSGLQFIPNSGGFAVLEPNSHTEEYVFSFGLRYCFDPLLSSSNTGEGRRWP